MSAGGGTGGDGGSAELGSGREDLIEGNIGTASGEDARGGSGGHGLNLLADAGDVGDGALGLGGDGVVDALLGAGRDDREILSGSEADNSGEDGSSVLHDGG